MASPAPDAAFEDPVDDGDTDYGSDFSPEQVQIVARLLTGEADIEDNPIASEIEHHDQQQSLRVPRILGREHRSPLFQAARAAEKVAEQIAESVKTGKHYSDLSNQWREISPEIEVPGGSVQVEPSTPDTRSPLERFRTQPKKALSVTDLVSPAWCELQYWYTLTRHGRKRRTPAMKRGSAVHKVLEDQVHTTIKVDIQTKEDAWGLRIWNVIQGLRTLRNTGQTRELEIWGTVDGLVVNGIIDELGYICPDKDLEESLEKPPQNETPSDQTTISDFFKAAGGSTLAEAAKSKRRYKTSKVYICDVKTRSARTLPNEASFRPTKMQLMLYHSILGLLATDKVNFSVLASRYDLDTTKLFSDSFLAQVGSLNDDTFYDAQSSPDASQESISQWSQDSMTTLLAHNCLSTLWSLMISELQITLPDGLASLGSILKAEYRSPDTGEIVGSKTFAMDSTVLDTYIAKEMQWWRGEREAQGVVVGEAFKCRSCEFAEECDWRLKKVEEAKEKVRMSRKRTSAV